MSEGGGRRKGTVQIVGGARRETEKTKQTGRRGGERRDRETIERQIETDRETDRQIGRRTAQSAPESAWPARLPTPRPLAASPPLPWHAPPREGGTDQREW